jgi:hypothetical protein
MSYYGNYKSNYRNYEFLEWLRGSCVMSGANTFSESEIATPVGRATNQAMALFCAEFESSVLDAPAHGDFVMMQLAKNSKAAEIYVNDSDLVFKTKPQAKFVTSGCDYSDLIIKKNVPRPILYAKSSLYFGMNSAGMAAALTGYVRVGYVLRFVHPSAMARALTD